MPITITPERDDLLTPFGMAIVQDRYLFPGETPQDMFADVAKRYQADDAHGQRVYDYMSRHWFMPATPVLSRRGLPISCFLNSVDDGMESIKSTWSENVDLASHGGGIGCVDSETEFLTENGWIKISSYQEGMKIAVVSEDGNSAHFQHPDKFISGPSDKLYRISNSVSDMVVSQNHRNFVRFDGKSNFGVKDTVYLLEGDRIKSARFKPFTEVRSSDGLNVTDDELRFMVAVAADSYDIIDRDTLRFSFVRQRKIDRLTALSEKLGLNYELNKEDGKTTFLFKSIGLRKKSMTFENFGGLSVHQCQVIHSELGYWDGSFDNRTGNLHFSTSKYEECDFIQYVIMNATQHRSSIREKRKGQYVVSETGEKHSTATSIVEFIPIDGKQYCFTTSSGLWLARRNNFIFVTGNSYWGHIRSIGEKVGNKGVTSGVIPFIKVQDSLTLAVSQGSLRRGSAAAYMPINHPEVEEFIDIRKPTGGDPNRRCLNIHHGVVVDDAFMHAVKSGKTYDLLSPKTGSVIKTVRARDLWIKLLTARMEQGEPYILYIDTVNKARPEIYKRNGLDVKTSNLCVEIVLKTSKDHHNIDRTAVCCLSSLNLETWDEWKDNPQFIEDVMLFLDNVLQSFIDHAPDSMERARYAAMRERSVGLGVMGFHSFLQARSIPFESVMAKVWNRKIFKHIRTQADSASVKLADERGACPDAIDAGINERFTHKIAIAPTASISIIAGSASPGIDPITANVYLQKTLSGSFSVRNRHLAKVLEKHGKNNEYTWSSITTNKGSVQHLGFLTEDERDVYKTAFEIDNRWNIEHAADRTPFICQSASTNLFLLADIHKRDLHEIHFLAWEKGLKSLYYCRSMSLQRAESVSGNVGVAADNVKPRTEPVHEECLACQ